MKTVANIRTALQTAKQRKSGYRRAKRRANESGFTLIELMVVIAIILILLVIGVGEYDKSVKRAREAALMQNLQTIRVAIDQFTLDKEAAPQSLDDLQQAGYLRSVPIDPMTRAKDWQLQFDNVVLSPEQTTTGVVDVHSNSEMVPLDNTGTYKDW